jgi:peptide-methionine (S)-S-oxide reductase
VTVGIPAHSTRLRSGECHQQYLHRNMNGYCGLGGTGISCPVGVVKTDG